LGKFGASEEQFQHSQHPNTAKSAMILRRHALLPLCHFIRGLFIRSDALSGKKSPNKVCSLPLHRFEPSSKFIKHGAPKTPDSLIADQLIVFGTTQRYCKILLNFASLTASRRNTAKSAMILRRHAHRDNTSKPIPSYLPPWPGRKNSKRWPVYNQFRRSHCL